MTELDLLESLLDCKSVEGLHAKTGRIVKQLGYEHFLYGVQVNTSLTNPYQFIFSHYPDNWLDHYFRSGYRDVDPAYIHCIKKRRVVPIIWGKHSYNTPIAEKLLNEAGEFGLGSGATLAIQGGHGEAALLSLASPRKTKRAKPDMLGTLGQAQLLTYYLHEAVQRIVLSKHPLPLALPALSPREKECLQWVAQGKTSIEIADILNLSERTVIFHITNAAQKMGVSTRKHAVARALSMGLIAP